MIQQNYLKKLSDKIKAEYDFNEYEIKPDTLKETTIILLKTIKDKNITDAIIDQFFNDLHAGKLGMFYRQPVSFLSVAYKFFDSKMLKLA